MIYLHSVEESAQFERAYALTLKYEGGYSNDPNDPGGATDMGVSERAVAGLRDSYGELVFDFDKDGDVDAEDIKRIREHPDLVKDWYHTHYWLEAGCNKLPWPINAAQFDCAVNCGPRQAIILLQRALLVKPDGVIGEQTLKAVRSVPLKILLVDMLSKRARYYCDISERRGATFLSGWLRRLFALQRDLSERWV